MARPKKKQLDIDIRAADAAGLSYGHYIAIKQTVTSLPVEVTIPEGTKHECAHCGKVFYRTDRYDVKYCSSICQEAAKIKRRKARRSA